MTTKTDKRLRAVFLAALMVFSVVAGTVAFSGSVAAANTINATDSSIEPASVYERTTNDHTIRLNATINTSDATDQNYTVAFPSEFDLSGASIDSWSISDTTNVAKGSSDIDGNQINVTVTDTASLGNGLNNEQINVTIQLHDVGVASVSSTVNKQAQFGIDEGADGTYEVALTDFQQLTIQNTASGAPELDSAIHYVDTGDEGAGVELVFSEPVNVPAASDVSLYDDGSAVAGTLSPAPGNGPAARYFLNTSGTVATGDVEIQLSSDVADVDGNSITDTDNQSVTVAPVTITVNDDQNVYEGSTVAIVDGNTNVDVEIEGPDNYYFSGSTGVNSEVFVFNTTNEALGQYNVSIDGSAIENTQITLRNLGLSVSLDSQSVTTEESIEGTVTASASDRPLTVELLDSSGDIVDGGTISSASLNGQGEYDFTFNVSNLNLDTGNYTVRVTDDYSGIEVESSTVAVSEAGDDEAGFRSNVVTDQRGDVFEIGVTMASTDYATLSFGTPSQGVVSNVTVHDDDGDNQATLYLDTYALQNAEAEYPAGSNDNPWSLDSDSDDEITFANVSTNVSNLIDAGEYDLEVRPGESETAASTDVATVVLEERDTTAFRSWTAPDSTSVSDLEDVTEALADGEITQTDEIANGDLIVHQLVSSGLEGALDAQGSEEVTQEFLNLKGTEGSGGVYNLTVEQADPGANQEAKMLNLSSTDNLTVIADGDNDTYFVIVDTAQARYYDGSAVADDTALEANFTVYNNASTDFAPESLDDDEDETTLLEYEVVEPTISIGEPHNVSNAAEQTLGGTTSLAPGTELTLRVRSTDDTSPSFLKTASPVVQADRTWSAAFDFSEQSVGDTYEIVVNDGAGGADEVTEEGTVVEVVETPTTTAPDTDTPDPSTETATPEPDTDTATPEPGTDTSEPGTETPTSTPGFGAVVALTALVAAALLAIRRD